MHPLDACRRFLLRHDIRNCRIAVAFSGGADSLSLLDVLCQLAADFSLEVTAIHVQHQLRGAESDGDEAFCRQFCQEQGIPLQVEVCDAAGYAETHGCSIETAARTCRYAAFAACCTSGYVATAHTASDNLETILFRLARGTGLRGLCGIPPVRDCYIRPFLDVTREEIEAYTTERGLSYVTDSSNLEDAYTRNFLRHRVVPLLKDCNPAIERTACDMAETLRLEQDFLEGAAAAALAQCRQTDGSLLGLEGLHPALQRRCIALFLQEHAIPASHDRILETEALLRQGGSVELVRGGMWAHVTHGRLSLLPPKQAVPPRPLQLGTQQLYPGIVCRASCISREDAADFARIHTMFANSVLDYAIIKEYAVLHSRTPGLRLHPAGREHSISIKKWLNASVLPSKRPFLHYLSDAEGLLWVEGLGAAARAAVTERTETMLFLEIYHKTDTDSTQ